VAYSRLGGEGRPWGRVDRNAGYFILVYITVGDYFLRVCD